MADETGTTTDAGTATDTDTDTTTGGDAGKRTTDTATDLGDAGKKALAEERRARKAAEKELETLRKAAMTDQEKAVAEAKAAGLADANKATAPRLVKAELRAAAAEAGVPKAALDSFLDYADLTRFLDDAGQVDDKAVTAAVKRLGGGNGRPNFDGGARGNAAPPADMNALIRRSAGIA